MSTQPRCAQPATVAACCRSRSVRPYLNSSAPSREKMVRPTGPGGKKTWMKPHTIMASRQPQSCMGEQDSRDS